MSDDLLREIQQAQVEAAEGAVVENLRRKGLLPPPEPVTPTNLRQFPVRVGAKVGIAIDLDHLRDLMREFAIKQEPDADKRVGLDWTFEIFLQWLRRRQETLDESTKRT